MMKPDERYMREALRLARRGLGRTSPNPCVGCVIVAWGEVVGRGYHKRAGEPHAEIEAIRDAGDRARGGVMYVNLEPCSTQGRTPPCVPAIVDAGIRRVVAAMQDPNPAVSGRGFDELRRHGIAVTVGVMGKDAALLNEAFAKHITTGMPFVLLKSAMTLDGKIASRSGDSKWISSEKAREYTHQLRTEYDAVMVGVGTVLADDPRLTAYMARAKKRRDPIRVIVDSQARTPSAATVISSGESPCIIATTQHAPKSRTDQLSAVGAEILVCESDADGRVSISDLMAKLGARGVMSVMIEGGGELAASALDSRVVDKLLFAVAPKVLGGRDAKTPVEGNGIEQAASASEFDVARVRQLGPDILIEAYPR